MAQPTSNYNELHPVYTTYKAAAGIIFDRTVAGGSADVGKAVKKTTTDREVDLVEDGEQILGLLKKVEADNFCSVHEGRYIELEDDGDDTISVGDFVCGGGVDGKIRAQDTEEFNNALVVAVGSAADKFIVQIL